MNRFQRIAHNQADFRDRNERSSHGGSTALETDVGPRYVCECGNPNCMAAVKISDQQYEHVRESSKRFVLLNGDHATPGGERVVEQHDGYVIAEKTEGLDVVAARDPRDLERSSRVLLVDDVVEVRMLIKMLIELDPDCTVVAEAGGVDEAIAKSKQVQPAIVVLDLELPDGSGYDALPEIVDAVPGVRVIIFSAADDINYRALATSGAFDVVPKGGDAKILMAAIRNAAGQTTVEAS